MIHPNTELRLVNPLVGFGVFATAPIPTGTIVYIKDQMEVTITPQSPLLQNPAYRPAIDRYSYMDHYGNRIISWDIAKYVNHCCHANTLSTGYGFEIAVTDIQPDQQITDDYRMFLAPDETMPLLCHHADCRGVLAPDEFDDLIPQWDTLIQSALADFNKLQQPLLPLLEPATRRLLYRYLRAGRDYHSVAAARPPRHTPTPTSLHSPAPN